MTLYVAFAGGRMISRGAIAQVAAAAKAATDAGEPRVVQIFDERTSEPCDLDLGGSVDDVLARLGAEDGEPLALVGVPRTQAGVIVASAPSRAVGAAERSGVGGALGGAVGPAIVLEPPRAGPGRPRLGVVAREVTLLPRHWAWLNEQSGGASAALRRLVDEARTTHAARDEVRRARDAVYRFLLATLGDAHGFEEAMRALYADDEDRFIAESAPWPPDLRTHALRLSRAVFHPKDS